MTNDNQTEVAREQFEQLSAIAIQTRNKLEAERNNPPDPARLTQEISQQNEKISALKTKLEHYKTSSKLRQDEISSWQTWFDSLEKADKTEEIKQLEQETLWRRQDISRLEQNIGDLYHKIHLAEAALLEKQSQQQALQEGLLELAVEDDPRLRGVLNELETLKQKMSAA